MLLIFIICFENVNCVIYNAFYCLYIECEINLSIYLVFKMNFVRFLNVSHSGSILSKVVVNKYMNSRSQFPQKNQENIPCVYVFC